jgi:hypothetical protein
MSCSCGKNTSCQCSTVSLSDLGQAVERIRAYFFCDNESLYKINILGFPGQRCQKTVNKLRVYEDAIERQMLIAAKGGAYQLPTNKIRSIWENVLSLTKDSCCSRENLCQKPDTKNKESWEKQNPECISKAKWVVYRERLLQDLAASIQVISALPIPDKANDLSVELRRQEIKCDIQVDLVAYKKLCQVDVEFNKNTVDCKVELALLKKEVKNCDITLKLYKKAVACDFSPKLIKKVYQTGAKICDQDGQIVILAGGEYIPVDQTPE